MKKLLVILCGLIILFSTCKKSDDNNVTGIKGCTNKNSFNYNPQATIDDGSCIFPEAKQRILVVQYTSTCCINCGGWGYDSLNNLIKTFGEEVLIPFAVHAGQPICIDVMTNEDLSYTFLLTLPASSTPSFYIGNTLGNKNYTSLVKTLKAKQPQAGVVLQKTLVGDTMKVKSIVKFFDNPSGTNWTGVYYMNVFILENGINGNQNAGAYTQTTPFTRSTYKHDYVLRTAAMPDINIGPELADGSVTPIAEGAIINKEFDIPLDPSWNYANLKVCAVIWLRHPTSYEYINGYLIK